VGCGGGRGCLIGLLVSHRFHLLLASLPDFGFQVSGFRFRVSGVGCREIKKAGIRCLLGLLISRGLRLVLAPPRGHLLHCLGAVRVRLVIDRHLFSGCRVQDAGFRMQG